MTLTRLCLFTFFCFAIALALVGRVSQYADEQKKQKQQEHQEAVEHLEHLCRVTWPTRGIHYEECLNGISMRYDL